MPVLDQHREPGKADLNLAEGRPMVEQIAPGRRDVLFTMAALVLQAQRRAHAQAETRRPRIAILSPNSRSHGQLPSSVLTSFISGLAELGYVDGQTVSFEFRFADDAQERLPMLATQLIDTEPDVIWTWASAGTRAAAAATSTIPIVVGVVLEEIMAELVRDFARPEGNVTGMTFNSREQHEKCLELLREAMPHVRRVGVLFNPLTPAWKGYPEALSGAARLLGLELVRAEAPGIAWVEHAFAAMAAQGVDAVFSPSDPTLVSSAQVPRPILDLIARYRLPAISDVPSLARAGGLLSLGADLPAIARRSAGYVRHILEGARPHELPVQRPAGFKLIVNLKAAEALGIQIPLSILARADEVIE